MKPDLYNVTEPEAEQIEFPIVAEGFINHVISDHRVSFLEFIVYVLIKIFDLFKVNLACDIDTSFVIAYRRPEQNKIEGEAFPENKLVAQLNSDIDDIKITFDLSGAVERGMQNINIVFKLVPVIAGKRSDENPVGCGPSVSLKQVKPVFHFKVDTSLLPAGNSNNFAIPYSNSIFK